MFLLFLSLRIAQTTFVLKMLCARFCRCFCYRSRICKPRFPAFQPSAFSLLSLSFAFELTSFLRLLFCCQGSNICSFSSQNFVMCYLYLQKVFYKNTKILFNFLRLLFSSLFSWASPDPFSIV